MRIIASGLIFLLPGYATLSALHPRLDLDVPQRLMVSTGLSVAVLPLLLFGSSLLGIKLGPLSVALLFLFLGMVSIWRLRGELLNKSSWKRFRAQIDAIYLLLLLIFALGLLVRFLMVRDLVVPMWGDSYHHTMISQLLVDNGGLFSSWEPYAPLRSFTYHFGFHSLVAFYHWLTGVSVIESVIVVGQLLNALSIPLAYLLTERLTQERWAGLIAALITGLLSPMPLYYVNWGRYTQLAGQVILPVAMIFLIDSLEGERWSLRSWILATVALAGLILTHYLVVVYYVAFALVYLVWNLVADRRSGGLILFRMVAVAFGAALLTMLWLVNLALNLLPSYISPPVQFSQEYLNVYFAFPGVEPYINYALGGVALLGTALAFLRRERGGVLVVLWMAVLCLAANAYRSRLPGTGLVNYFGVLIAAYLPVSILVGLLFARLIETLGLERSKGKVILVTLVLGAALVGTLHPLAHLDSSYLLVHPADAEALDWIAKNTPPSAKFLVNSFSASGEGGVIVGSDAGWWIPLWTGRENSVPPINYMWERIEESDFDEIYALASIDLERIESPDTLSVLERYGITHVYIGKQGGRMKPETFARSPVYREIYNKGGVAIFEIEYSSEVGGRES